MLDSAEQADRIESEAMNEPPEAPRNPLTRLFFDEHSKLRSGWRFFVFLSVFFVMAAFAGGIFRFLLFQLSIDVESNSLLARVFQPLIGLTAAVVVGWLCLKLLEGLPYRALGTAFTKYWLRDLILGILIGAAAISGAVAVAALFGGLRFQYNSAAGSSAIGLTLAATLLIFVAGAAFEEALIRGYIFQTFVRSGLWWLALALTSLLFAAGHLGNTGATLFSTINTGMAGIWLGVSYLKTRTLWFVFGLHFAWNWVQGSFFGIEVSGFDSFATAPLLREIDNGPAWITGGDYGIEGGAACTLVLVLVTVLIWYLPFLNADEEMLALTSPKPVNTTHDMA